MPDNTPNTQETDYSAMHDPAASPEALHQQATTLLAKPKGTVPASSWEQLALHSSVKPETLSAIYHGAVAPPDPTEIEGKANFEDHSTARQIVQHPNVPAAVAEDFMRRTYNHAAKGSTAARYFAAASQVPGVSQELKHELLGKALDIGDRYYSDFNMHGADPQYIVNKIKESATNEEKWNTHHGILGHVLTNADHSPQSLESTLQALEALPKGKRDEFASYFNLGEFASKHPTATQDQIKRLANLVPEYGSGEHLSGIFTHPAVDRSWIAAKAMEGRGPVSTAAIQSPNLPEEVKKSIINNAVAAKLNGNTGSDDWYRGYDLARNPSLNSTELQELSRGGFDVLRHPNVDPNTIRAAWQASDKQTNAGRKFLRLPSVPEDLLTELVNHKNQNVAIEALQHSSVTKPIVEAALKRRAKRVQEAALKHPLVAEDETVKRLMSGQLPYHRIVSRDLSGIYDKIPQDKKDEIQKAVSQKLAGADIEKMAKGLKQTPEDIVNSKVQLARLGGTEGEKHVKDLADIVKNSDPNSPSPYHDQVKSLLINKAQEGNPDALDAVMTNNHLLDRMDWSSPKISPEALKTVYDKVKMMPPDDQPQSTKQQLASNPALPQEQFNEIVSDPKFLENEVYQQNRRLYDYDREGYSNVLDNRFKDLDPAVSRQAFSAISATNNEDANKLIVTSKSAPEDLWNQAWVKLSPDAQKDYLYRTDNKLMEKLDEPSKTALASGSAGSEVGRNLLKRLKPEDSKVFDAALATYVQGGHDNENVPRFDSFLNSNPDFWTGKNGDDREANLIQSLSTTDAGNLIGFRAALGNGMLTRHQDSWRRMNSYSDEDLSSVAKKVSDKVNGYFPEDKRASIWSGILEGNGIAATVLGSAVSRSPSSQEVFTELPDNTDESLLAKKEIYGRLLDLTPKGNLSSKIAETLKTDPRYLSVALRNPNAQLRTDAMDYFLNSNAPLDNETSVHFGDMFRNRMANSNFNDRLLDSSVKYIHKMDQNDPNRDILKNMAFYSGKTSPNAFQKIISAIDSHFGNSHVGNEALADLAISGHRFSWLNDALGSRIESSNDVATALRLSSQLQNLPTGVSNVIENALKSPESLDNNAFSGLMHVLNLPGTTLKTISTTVKSAFQRIDQDPAGTKNIQGALLGQLSSGLANSKLSDKVAKVFLTSIKGFESRFGRTPDSVRALVYGLDASCKLDTDEKAKLFVSLPDDAPISNADVDTNILENLEVVESAKMGNKFGFVASNVEKLSGPLARVVVNRALDSYTNNPDLLENIATLAIRNTKLNRGDLKSILRALPVSNFAQLVGNRRGDSNPTFDVLDVGLDHFSNKELNGKVRAEIFSNACKFGDEDAHQPVLSKMVSVAASDPQLLQDSVDYLKHGVRNITKFVDQDSSLAALKILGYNPYATDTSKLTNTDSIKWMNQAADLSHDGWKQTLSEHPEMFFALSGRDSLDSNIIDAIDFDTLLAAPDNAKLVSLAIPGLVSKMTKEAKEKNIDSFLAKTTGFVSFTDAITQFGPMVSYDQLVNGWDKLGLGEMKIITDPPPSQTRAVNVVGKLVSAGCGGQKFFDEVYRKSTESNGKIYWDKLAKSPHITADFVSHLCEKALVEDTPTVVSAIRNVYLAPGNGDKVVPYLAKMKKDGNDDSADRVLNAAFMSPGLSESAFGDLCQYDDDYENFLKGTDGFAANSKCPPPFLNPQWGGKLQRKIPSKIAEPEEMKIDQNNLINKVTMPSKATERLTQGMQSLPAQGMLWKDFKRQQPKLANLPEIQKVFMKKNNQLVFPEDFAAELAKAPAGEEYAISYADWTSNLQKHNPSGNPHQLVVQMNNSDWLEGKMQEDPKMWALFQKVQSWVATEHEVDAHGMPVFGGIMAHPVTPSTISWSRVDTSQGKKGWIVEEFQSDVMRKFSEVIDKLCKLSPSAGLKISGQPLSNDELNTYSTKIKGLLKNWIKAQYRAVEDLARKQGVENLYIHGSGIRAAMSGNEPNSMPHSLFERYDELPQENGFEKIDYRDYPTKTKFLSDSRYLAGHSTHCWKKKLA